MMSDGRIDQSTEAWSVKLLEALGEIRASLQHLELEVQKLRDWRHITSDRLAPLFNLPDLILALEEKLDALRDQVAEMQRQYARLDGERAALAAARVERERLEERWAAWLRWAVPSGWLLIVGAFVAWVWAQLRGN